MKKLPFFKISAGFSCGHEFRVFDEQVGRYWDNLYSAKLAIERWAKNGDHYLFGVWEGREVSDIKVLFVEDFGRGIEGDPNLSAENAAGIVVRAKVRERKHLGLKTEWKTITGPDGEEYSRSVKVDKGYEWTDDEVRVVFEIARLELNKAE